MMTDPQLAILRQRVDRLCARRATLEHVAMRRHRMIAASLLARRFRPEGPLAFYLSVPSPDNSRHLYVRKAQVAAISRDTEAWRAFSQAMAEWVRVNREIEELLRRIGKGRCRDVRAALRKRR